MQADSLTISVLPGNWGEGDLQKTEKLLYDVASHILRELRDPVNYEIHVINRPEFDWPQVFFREPNQDRFFVNLSTKNRLWAQCAYQFSHELCHILSGFERLRDNPNNWFHETICELASLFTLRKMAERWVKNPPFLHGRSYSTSLRSYSEDRINAFRSIDLRGTFGSWLALQESILRADSCRRDDNGIVAVRLLPLFEEQPTGWNAITQLPVSEDRIHQYIESWIECVEKADQGFVRQIARSMSLA